MYNYKRYRFDDRKILFWHKRIYNMVFRKNRFLLDFHYLTLEEFHKAMAKV